MTRPVWKSVWKSDLRPSYFVAHMPTSVAIQGERGAFSEAAARKLLGTDIEVRPCRTFDEVFAAVSSGVTSVAVVPIENSLAGSVHRTYELLGSGGLEIAAETLLRIRLNLIGSPDSELSDVRRVLSHPVALAQCQRFLATLAGVEAVASYDTAGSVKLVMDGGRRDEAAIAADVAAEIYGAKVLVHGVEDHFENFTRFLLLTKPGGTNGHGRTNPTAVMKTTVVFRTPNKPGALFRALAAFALRDINLTKLESRPIEGHPWEYAFYADVVGGSADPSLAHALDHLREICETVLVLGSYGAVLDANNHDH